MNGPDERRADHSPYIAAVRDRLAARDIQVTNMSVTTAPGDLRQAALELHPDPDEFPGPVRDQASAHWDEDTGWSLRITQDSLPDHEVREGASALPDPDAVAAWVLVALTHPELTPANDGPPFRQHQHPDPDFEARLARYAPGA